MAEANPSRRLPTSMGVRTLSAYDLGGASAVITPANPSRRLPTSMGVRTLSAYDLGGASAVITPASIAPTFRYMAARKLERRLGGVVEKPRSTLGRRLLWLFAIVVWWAGIFQLDLGATAAGGAPEELRVSFSLGLGAGVLLACVATLGALYFLLKIAEVIHWALYWVYVVFFVELYVVVSSTQRAALTDLDLFASSMKDASYTWGFHLLGALEALTVGGWLAVHFLSPFALQRLSEPALVSMCRIRAAGQAADLGAGASFSYSSPWWQLTWPLLALRKCSPLRREHFFFYSGSTRAGRPHGYGEWRDDAPDGECLRGYWNNGRPVPPFTSRIYKTGFAFSSLHVAYATARSEGVDDVTCLPTRHAHAGLRFGVAFVESSISGEFFSNYPKHELLWESPDSSLSASLLAPDVHNAAQAAHALSLIRHADELLPVESVSVALRPDGRGLMVAGFEPVRRRLRRGAGGQGGRGAGVEDGGEEADEDEGAQRVEIVVASLDNPQEEEEEAEEEAVGKEAAQSTQQPELGRWLRLWRQRPTAAFSAPEAAAEGVDEEDALAGGGGTGSTLDQLSAPPELPSSRRRFVAALVQPQPPSSLRRYATLPASLRAPASAFARRDTNALSLMPPPLSEAATSVSSQPATAAADASGSLHGQEASAAEGDTPPSAGEVPPVVEIGSQWLHVRGWRPIGARSSPLLQEGQASSSGSAAAGGAGGALAPQQHACEVLLYVHGFNMTIGEGLARLGQFLALGHLPPHIKPIVFSWPTAKIATYMHATATANATQTGRDLRALLAGLADSGVHTVHVLTHSMGAQAFVCHIDEIAAELRSLGGGGGGVGGGDGGGGGGSGVGSAHADELEMGPPAPAPPLPQQQPRLGGGRGAVGEEGPLAGKPSSDYAAEAGAAAGTPPSPAAAGARSAESGGLCQPLLGGRAPAQPQPPGGAAPRQLLRLASVTMINPEIPEDAFLNRWLPKLQRFCPLITVYGDEEDRALFWSELLNRKAMLGRLRGAPYRAYTSIESAAEAVSPSTHYSRAERSRRALAALALEGLESQWRHIDVIDMTWLQSNVHALRHNSFNLNRSLVDDLRELIVDGRRAAQRRSRLVRRKGNVFTFLQPPSHVVND